MHLGGTPERFFFFLSLLSRGTPLLVHLVFFLFLFLVLGQCARLWQSTLSTYSEFLDSGEPEQTARSSRKRARNLQVAGFLLQDGLAALMQGTSH